MSLNQTDAAGSRETQQTSLVNQKSDSKKYLRIGAIVFLILAALAATGFGTTGIMHQSHMIELPSFLEKVFELITDTPLKAIPLYVIAIGGPIVFIATCLYLVLTAHSPKKVQEKKNPEDEAKKGGAPDSPNQVGEGEEQKEAVKEETGDAEAGGTEEEKSAAGNQRARDAAAEAEKKAKEDEETAKEEAKERAAKGAEEAGEKEIDSDQIVQISDAAKTKAELEKVVEELRKGAEAIRIAAEKTKKAAKEQAEIERAKEQAKIERLENAKKKAQSDMFYGSTF